MELFATGCEYVVKGADAVVKGAGALDSVGRVIGGSTNYLFKVRKKECYYCGAKLRGPDLPQHVKGHRDHLEHCYLCDKTFQAEDLKSHVIETHSVVECPACMATVKIEKYIDHVESHRLNNFEECYICKQRFRADELKSHVVEKHSVIQCRACNETVKIDMYLDHVEGHRFIKNYEDCYICEKKFRAQDIKSHVIDAHSMIKCPSCKEVVNILKYMDHVETHRQHLKECYVCDSTFFKEDLKAHVGEHSVIECKHCKKIVKVDDFVDHVETHRLTNSHKLCFICEKEFEEEELKLHVVETHSMIKCRVCTDIVKVEEYIDHVENHRLTKTHHTRCYLCDKDFKEERLQTHVIEAHGMIECRTCYEIVRIEAYADHVETHRFIKCHECFKNIKLDDFSSHSESHRAEVCYECAEMIPLKLWKDHIRKHREEELREEEDQNKTLPYLKDMIPMTNSVQDYQMTTITEEELREEEDQNKTLPYLKDMIPITNSVQDYQMTTITKQITVPSIQSDMQELGLEDNKNQIIQSDMQKLGLEDNK